MKSRVAWIDIAKGLGILFVILGHLPIPLPLLMLLRSFNMPCFFFVSGLLFPQAKLLGVFAQHKFATLLKPYLFFSLISFSIWWLLRPLSTTQQGVDPFLTLLSIPYATNQPGMFMAHNMPLWFLPCLFVTSLMFFGFSRLSAWKSLIASLVAAWVGYHWSAWFGIRPFWSLDVAMVALPFMWAGYNLRSWFITPKPLPAYLIIMLAMVNVLACFANTPVDMNYGHYGNLFLFGIAAVAGLLCITNIAKHLTQFKIANTLLAPLGKNSLYILGFHGLAYSLLNGVRHKLEHGTYTVHHLSNTAGHMVHHFSQALNPINSLLTVGMDTGLNILVLAIYLAAGLFVSRGAKHVLCAYI